MIWEELGLSRADLAEMPADDVEELIVISNARATALEELAEMRRAMKTR